MAVALHKLVERVASCGIVLSPINDSHGLDNNVVGKYSCLFLRYTRVEPISWFSFAYGVRSNDHRLTGDLIFLVSGNLSFTHRLTRIIDYNASSPRRKSETLPDQFPQVVRWRRIALKNVRPLTFYFSFSSFPSFVDPYIPPFDGIF